MRTAEVIRCVNGGLQGKMPCYLSIALDISLLLIRVQYCWLLTYDGDRFVRLKTEGRCRI